MWGKALNLGMREGYCLAILALGLAMLPVSRSIADEDEVRGQGDFESVAQLLVERCISCHNASERHGGLDLTGAAATFAGGDSGPVIEPGQPASSYLWERISDGSMPPEGRGLRLSAKHVEQVRQWIADGAKWPQDRRLSPYERTTEERAGYDWWALQPIAEHRLPAVRRAEWPTSPIDHFILARLEAEGLSPAQRAEKWILLRRAKLDLLGIPPTREEVDEFLADESPHAFAALVDRFLASPHYGERWGRHWLDVVRYGESDGFENDKFRPHAWRYRDYVIRSFNQDKPYPTFVLEQLAGDVFAEPTPESRVATGFLVTGPWDEVQSAGQSRSERLRTREEQLEELVTAVSQTFLGLTVHCARCHDHKFDPIPQSDYYRLKAVFEGIDHERNSNQPIWDPLEAERHHAALAALDAKLAEVERQAEGSEDVAREEVDRWKRERALLVDQVPLAYLGVRRQPEPTVLFQRGDIQSPGEQIPPGALSAVRQISPDLGLDLDAPEGERRLRFGRWLTREEHPLTARVMVNRIWQYHFGRGLVATSSDFGFQGGLPTHPELLDWLASYFIECDWSVKQLHRLIMLSSTYQQSASWNETAAQTDGDGELYWRFAPRRLEGEIVRDLMLAVSGEWNPVIGGPSFQPFTVTVFNTHFYHLFDRGTAEFNRRTIYRANVMTGRSPLLDALDCPCPSTLTPQRSRTVTPLQALSLMNDSFVDRQARQFAARVSEEATDVTARTAHAFRLAFGRPPTEEEQAASLVVVREHGLEALCWTLLNASEFIYLR